MNIEKIFPKGVSEWSLHLEGAYYRASWKVGSKWFILGSISSLVILAKEVALTLLNDEDLI